MHKSIYVKLGENEIISQHSLTFKVFITATRNASMIQLTH